MNDYEAGYRAMVAGELKQEMSDHWRGSKVLEKSDEFFTGYQDATDDVSWARQGIEQMQFGLTAPR